MKRVCLTDPELIDASMYPINMHKRIEIFIRENVKL